MFKCGFVRSNFSFAIGLPLPLASADCCRAGDYGLGTGSLAADSGDDLLRDRLRYLLVGVELHRVRRAPLGP